jgi:hypothetical protein
MRFMVTLSQWVDKKRADYPTRTAQAAKRSALLKRRL